MLYQYATAVGVTWTRMHHNTDALPIRHSSRRNLDSLRHNTDALPIRHRSRRNLDSLRHNTDALPIRHSSQNDIIPMARVYPWLEYTQPSASKIIDTDI